MKTKISTSPSAANQVEAFISNLKHPFRKEIEEVRNIILNTDKKITEQIKWNAPSFCYNGDDRITFNLQGKGFFRLIFHCGAKAKDNKSKTRLFEDTTGLLEWVANDRAVLKFTDMNDLNAKKKELTSIIKKWLKATC